jgi:hypothetical protein
LSIAPRPFSSSDVFTPTSVTFDMPPFKDVYWKIFLLINPFTRYYIIIIMTVVIVDRIELIR